MATYRLGSSPAVHTPGIVAWAINGYHFEDDRPNCARSSWKTYNLPEIAADQLLSKKVPYTIEGETVVFTVSDESEPQ
ncbi:hypothetical protein G3A56_25685 (plasmid) [Rhizobium oryzihabitans]|uniref:Uncharacterized protein n=1 Tax=Rhizobium oryzihabitans TaxID=2267833 RepID=A0A7L5BR61_9HYPH|nr:hypothetical protein [Rhizobium oryzihabitans]QIB41251.1 hypothetical protein G3A56_25685 [Rhizobium oryzihabitans]